MTIPQYLGLKYMFGDKISLSAPECLPGTCYDLLNVPSDCTVFEGDLVVSEDALNETRIETITGCLIVQKGTHLDFLKQLKKVGDYCQYQDGKKYPLSPSRGFPKTTISQMKTEYCPPRGERERLALVTKLTVFELSGKDRACCKLPSLFFISIFFSQELYRNGSRKL